MFLLHARHATFYIFHATFPNTYLRDISLHGANYKHRVSKPHEVIIEHSKPFRMRKPTHQAEFFRLFAGVLCYLFSGNKDAGYISKNEWNPYWHVQTG